MAAPQVDILVESSLWDGVPQAHDVVRRAVRAVGTKRGTKRAIRRGDAIGVSLADDAAIAVLNLRWRGKDGPTNVLSFPSAPPPIAGSSHFLGATVLAFESPAREAEGESRTFDDHLAHLVVHGLLHLLGYDHLTDDEAQEMEALESRVLAKLGVADPYAIDAA